jgi:hypothetical protein
MTSIRHLVAIVASCVLVGLTAHANTRSNPKILIEDTATKQAQLKRAFEAFRTRLAVLANRLENGTAEDRKKAQSLRKAIQLIISLGTTGRFDSIIGALSKKNSNESIDVLGQIVKDNKELRQDLQKILAMLLEGDSARKLAQRKSRAKELLDKLKDVRDKQARLQATTEMGKQDPKGLARVQNKIIDSTRETLEPPEDADEQNFEEIETVRKPVEDAIRQQKMAGKSLKGGNATGAADSQAKAVDKLNEAIKKLEELLRQLRQEERQQKLADLLARCKRMLAQQKEVRDATEKLDRDIARTIDGKPRLTHASRSTKLADQQLGIVREAAAALKLVRSEDTAVVFAEVLEQVHNDTDTIHSRLERTDVGTVTQSIENDVIATLEDIIKALEKAIQEPDEDEGNPRSPRNNPPRDRKLVNFLQQLKMIMAMQRRIHQRTELYGKTYKGEQAPDVHTARTDKEKQHYALVQKELKDLAGRQDRLARATREVSKQPEARMQE